MDNSLFGKLPAELRTSIYELALFSPNGIELGFIKAPVQENWEEDSTLAIRPLNPHQLSPNLLSTCKQIHHEALPALLSNTFKVDTDWEFLLHNASPAASALGEWATTYGPAHAPLVKNLRITYSDIGVENLTGIATFSRLLLQLLAPVGITPSITLSLDFILRAMDWDSRSIACLDLGRNSPAENRIAVRKAVQEAQVCVRETAWPWKYAQQSPLDLTYDDPLACKWIRDEGAYAERLVGYVQEGEGWTTHENESKGEYERGGVSEADKGGNQGSLDAESDEKSSRQGSRRRRNRGWKKKAVKGKGKKW